MRRLSSSRVAILGRFRVAIWRSLGLSARKGVGCFRRGVYDRVSIRRQCGICSVTHSVFSFCCSVARSASHPRVYRMSMVAEEVCYAHFLVYVETLVPHANWIAMRLWTKVVLQQSARTVSAVLQRAPGREDLEQGLKGQLRHLQMRIRNQLAGFCASCIVYQPDIRMLWFRGVEARVPSSALSHLQPLLSR